jgi:hypothetical protein
VYFIISLKVQNGSAAKIFVDTSSLFSIHPFGLDVFKKNCAINGLSRRLTFTEKYSDIMKPPESSLSV